MTEQDDIPKTLTTAEAASRLGVTESRVKAMLKAGILTGVNEPFGPGTRWKINADSVTARKRLSRRGKVKSGRPKKD